MAEKYPSWSPYNYVLNNPVNVIDPDGMEAETFIQESTRAVWGGTGVKLGSVEEQRGSNGGSNTNGGCPPRCTESELKDLVSKLSQNNNTANSSVAIGIGLRTAPVIVSEGILAELLSIVGRGALILTLPLTLPCDCKIPEKKYTVIYRNADIGKPQQLTPRPYRGENLNNDVGIPNKNGAGLSFFLLTPDILVNQREPIVITTAEAINATRILRATNDRASHYAIYPVSVISANLPYPNDINWYKLYEWANTKELAGQTKIGHSYTTIIQALSIEKKR